MPRYSSCWRLEIYPTLCAPILCLVTGECTTITMYVFVMNYRRKKRIICSLSTHTETHTTYTHTSHHTHTPYTHTTHTHHIHTHTSHHTHTPYTHHTHTPHTHTPHTTHTHHTHTHHTHTPHTPHTHTPHTNLLFYHLVHIQLLTEAQVFFSLGEVVFNCPEPAHNTNSYK